MVGQLTNKKLLTRLSGQGPRSKCFVTTASASRTTNIVDRQTIYDSFSEFRELNAVTMQNNAIVLQETAHRDARSAFELRPYRCQEGAITSASEALQISC